MPRNTCIYCMPALRGLKPFDCYLVMANISAVVIPTYVGLSTRYYISKGWDVQSPGSSLPSKRVTHNIVSCVLPTCYIYLILKVTSALPAYNIVTPRPRWVVCRIYKVNETDCCHPSENQSWIGIGETGGVRGVDTRTYECSNWQVAWSASNRKRDDDQGV